MTYQEKFDIMFSAEMQQFIGHVGQYEDLSGNGLDKFVSEDEVLMMRDLCNLYKQLNQKLSDANPVTKQPTTYAKS